MPNRVPLRLLPPRWLVPLGVLACALAPVPAWAALLAGIALGLSGGNAFAGQTPRIAQLLLQASVIALGAGMNIAEVARAGLNSFGITFIMIAFTLWLGRALGRRLGLSADATLLISGGTAICGGSAIAALSGTVKPLAHDTAIALITVFVLNAVALVIFPPLGHAAGLSEHQFGWWAALAIHDMSSVVGAGLVFGGVAASVATTVKLARALWIVPVTVWFSHRRGHAARTAGASPDFPWFILGFLAVAAVFTAWPAPEAVLRGITVVAHRGLGVTLFLIGAGVSRTALRDTGTRPLALGLALWVVVGSASLIAIKAGLIG